MTNYYKNIIRIPNGAWIGEANHRYDLGYKDKVILTDCVNYSYVSGRLIALKKDNKIYVFSTNITVIGSEETLEKIAEFTAFRDIAYLKVICEHYTYLIDRNCQIKFSNRAPIN